MGTYDTRGGSPLHDPMGDYDPACEVCQRPASSCICEECTECHTAGDPNCYLGHLSVTDAELTDLVELAIERHDGVDTHLVRALRELQVRRQQERKKWNFTVCNRLRKTADGEALWQLLMDKRIEISEQHFRAHLDEAVPLALDDGE